MVHEQSKEILDNGEPIPPGYEVLRRVEPSRTGGQPLVESVVVKEKSERGLTGSAIKHAWRCAQHGRTGN